MKNRIYCALALLSLSLASCEKEQMPTVHLPSTERHISYQSSKHLRVVIDGNSLAAGQGSSFGGYASMLRDSGMLVRNLAIGGQSTLSMIDSHTDVDTALRPGCILVVDECTNDLYFGASVDTAYGRLVRYCADRRAVQPDIRIVIVTPTPRSNAGTPTDFEQNRLALIARIRSSHPFCDAVADAGSDPLIGITGSELNALYYFDLVHHTDAGYLVRGTIVWDVVRRVQTNRAWNNQHE